MKSAVWIVTLLVAVLWTSGCGKAEKKPPAGAPGETPSVEITPPTESEPAAPTEEATTAPEEATPTPPAKPAEADTGTAKPPADTEATTKSGKPRVIGAMGNALRKAVVGTK